MKKHPSAYTISTLQAVLKNGCSAGIGNTWYPARPEGLCSIKSRFRLAWEVFTGRADVLRWPGNQ